MRKKFTGGKVDRRGSPGATRPSTCHTIAALVPMAGCTPRRKRPSGMVTRCASSTPMGVEVSLP
ncbi:MAG: hypothetical protein QM783_02595 [Phycisphaerales bacterium]